MSEDLLKVTLNLFASDVEALKRRYGYGWSERIRELVRKHVREKNAEYPVELAEYMRKNDAKG